MCKDTAPVRRGPEGIVRVHEDTYTLRREQAIAVGECIIGGNDLDHALVEQVDVGGEANNAAARKTLQHRIFQQSGGIVGGDWR